MRLSSLKRSLFAAFFLVGILAPQMTWAWGQIGHRIVGEIAYRNLTPKARAAVDKLLYPITLADSATWPDEIRSDPNWKHASPWHYVSIAPGGQYLTTPRYAGGDVIEAMCRMEDKLRDPKLDPKLKAEALKFLTHFVGDLHQPLHVGRFDDRGGNNFHVKWFDKAMNLHALWDEAMVEFEKYTYSEYSDLLNLRSEGEKKEIQKGTYLDWANESLGLRDQLYPPTADAALGYAYHYQHKTLLRRRLLEGGLRLAMIINNVFDGVELTSEEKQLRDDIAKMPTRSL